MQSSAPLWTRTTCLSPHLRLRRAVTTSLQAADRVQHLLRATSTTLTSQLVKRSQAAPACSSQSFICLLQPFLQSLSRVRRLPPFRHRRARIRIRLSLPMLWSTSPSPRQSLAQMRVRALLFKVQMAGRPVCSSSLELPVSTSVQKASGWQEAPSARGRSRVAPRQGEELRKHRQGFRVLEVRLSRPAVQSCRLLSSRTTSSSPTKLSPCRRPISAGRRALASVSVWKASLDRVRQVTRGRKLLRRLLLRISLAKEPPAPLTASASRRRRAPLRRQLPPLTRPSLHSRLRRGRLRRPSPLVQ